MTEIEEVELEESKIPVPPKIIEIGEIIFKNLLKKYPTRVLMDIIKDSSPKDVFLVTSRENPEKVSLVVDNSGKLRYCCEDPLMIPIPKKFAVLEPDMSYFESTFRANIFLALMKASSEELHR